VANDEILVYRSAKTFPPTEQEYQTFHETRHGQIHGAERYKRAARGLSCYTTLDSAIANAQRFPLLGALVVRYRIPPDGGYHVEHIVGSVEHLTLFGDNLSSLAQYLDNWVHYVERRPSEARGDPQ